MKKVIPYIIAFLLIQCKPDIDYQLQGYTEKIIVEGIIESGEYPRVYLTKNVPLWQEMDSISLRKKVIRSAKITISCNDELEVLHAEWDNEQIPPYVYRGTKIKGKEGESYSLLIEYSGNTFEATTTVPYKPKINGFKSYASENSDSSKVLYAEILIDNKNYGYRIFSRRPDETKYAETRIIYNENFNLTGGQQFLINPLAIRNIQDNDSQDKFFPGDSVFVKIMVLDSISTTFFKAFSIGAEFDKQANIDQINPLNSNISKPGFGIWYGAGVEEHLVIIQ